MGTTIRPLRPEDAQAALCLARGLHDYFNPTGLRVMAVDLKTQHGLAAVEPDGRLAGFLLWYTHEGAGRIGWLAVRRDCHRRGIGRQLVAALERTLRDLGCDAMEVGTLGEGADCPPYAATRAFYRAVGLTDYRILKQDNPACPEELILRKRLDGSPAAQRPIVQDVRMGIEVLPGREQDIPVVRNLARFYLYDYTDYTDWACPESGLFGGCDEFFDDWRAGRMQPYVVRVKGELAGFAGVKDMAGPSGLEHCIPEFFVLRKFRRRGVGSHVAVRLFDRYPGPWCVRQMVENLRAVAFWRKVIGDYTGDRFSEERETTPWGEMNAIRFRSGPA